ncbi:hypothetical protein [Nocardia sp. NPDC005978]|uniref:hypothetical protein n=1 Tax=unclassified Nocardia TaxID=2637762 RepID=UPI0033A55734
MNFQKSHEDKEFAGISRKMFSVGETGGRIILGPVPHIGRDIGSITDHRQLPGLETPEEAR